MRLFAENISYSYLGRPQVLTGVDLRVASGEAVAVIGSSGAGKSTLFRILAGLAEPQEGCVCVDDIDVRRLRADARRGAVGFVHQQHGLPPALSVEMAVLGGAMHGWSAWKTLVSPVLGASRAERERVDRVLTCVGLDGLGDERVAELSLGQRQRVAVARALLQQPDILIADEPVASVDPATADVVLELLRAEAARGAAVLCSVHDVDKAMRHFPRIVALAGGRVVFDGDRAELTDEIIEMVYRGEAA